MTRITGTLHEDQYTFLTYSAEFFLELGMFQTNFRENRNSVLCPSPPFGRRAVYEIMWKNIVEPCTPQMAVWRMPITFGT
jgi:hypothetical protein